MELYRQSLTYVQKQKEKICDNIQQNKELHRFFLKFLVDFKTKS